jgi:hypothetical protein
MMLQQLEQLSFASNTGVSQSLYRVSLPYFVSDQLQEYSIAQEEPPYYDTVP